MKQTILLLTISVLCLTAQFSFGQITSTKEKTKKPYIVWVTPIDKTPTIIGYLSGVGDTLVVTDIHMNQTEKRIRLDNVRYLEYYRKGMKGESIVVGSVLGFVVGAIVGLNSYEPCTPQGWCIDFGPGGTALAGGILGSLPGLTIGWAVGGKKKLIIQGSTNSIKAQKKKLLKYKFGN